MNNIYSTIVRENCQWQGIAVRDRGNEYTYPQLFADVENLAEKLHAYGISPEDRCIFIADDSYSYIVYSLAILKLNAAIIPLSTRAVKTELDNMLKSLPWEYLIAPAEYKTTSPVLQELPEGCILQKNSISFEKTRLPEGEKPAFIRFSSGTTGKNKGVILSHKSVLERTQACTLLDIGRGENVLWVLDMAYHFVVTILLFLRRGSTIVICEHPVETKMAEYMEKYPVTLLYATPYHYQIMAKSALYSAELFRQVRMAVSTAMALPMETAKVFQKKFAISLNQAYGIIEIGLPCINPAVGEEAKLNSAGKLQDAYQVKIDSPDSEGIGEILLKGPGMFDAYLSPFTLREEVCRNGYFVTGDLGYIDAEGFLFIAGRSKNVIIFAGMKIFPYEVENILLEHPAVEEVYVYGIPSGEWGELPAAQIVLAPGCVPDGELKRELRSFCYSRMSEYKVPKQFTFTDELKKTASGKIIRA